MKICRAIHQRERMPTRCPGMPTCSRPWEPKRDCGSCNRCCQPIQKTLVVGEFQKEFRHSSFDPFLSLGDAEERGPCTRAVREYVLTVHRQYRCSSRIVAVPL